MSESRVSIGIIGLGGNGCGHLHAHMQSPASKVVALCDRNRERLERAGAEHGIGKLYTDDAIFADPEIDAISIHTGDGEHREPFIKALGAGKHVLVEKPLANSEEDIHAMVAAADAAPARLRIQVGYILRFNPVFEEVHRLARAGDLGEIYYLEGDYIHNLLYQAEKSDPVTGENWYLDRELPMVGGGSHPLDILRWVSGKEIVRTWGSSNHVAFPAMTNDDCQVALFEFEDGAIAKVASLYGPRTARPGFNNLRVYGTKGTVERDTVALSASPEDVHPEYRPIEADRVAGHPYTPEIEDWLHAILQDRETRIPLWDGANSTMAGLCAVRAMRERRTVDVPVFGRRSKPAAG